jgi:parallel beta-helix repeat protein
LLHYLKKDKDIAGIQKNLTAGDVLVLGTGIWFLKNTWLIDFDLTIVGKAPGKSKICCDNHETGLKLTNNASLLIRDLELYHSSLHKESCLIDVTEGKLNASNCIFSANEKAERPTGMFAFSQKDGIRMFANSSIELFQAQFLHFLGNALSFKKNSSGNIIDCTFFNNGVGVTFNEQSTGNLLRNTFSENLGGFCLYSECLCEAGLNICQKNNVSGIRINSANAYVTQNICRNNQTGITISGESNSIIEKNDCSENHKAGILILSNARGKVIENKCNRNKEDGIYVDDDAWPEIKRNECNENGDSGMRFMDHSRPSVYGNECFKNRIFGIYKAGRAKPDVRNNQCEENGKENYCFARPTWYDATAR